METARYPIDTKMDLEKDTRLVHPRPVRFMTSDDVAYPVELQCRMPIIYASFSSLRLASSARFPPTHIGQTKQCPILAASLPMLPRRPWSPNSARSCARRTTWAIPGRRAPRAHQETARTWVCGGMQSLALSRESRSASCDGGRTDAMPDRRKWR